MHQHGSLHNTALTADPHRPRKALYPDLLHCKPIDDGVLQRWQDAVVLGFFCLGAKSTVDI
jgi:hypothetical protein